MSRHEIPCPQTPGLAPPIEVPTNSLGALSAFAITYATHIAAPPLQCIEKLVDSSTWPEWNLLCRKATIDAANSPSIDDATVNDTELRAIISRHPSRYLYLGVHFSVDVYLDDAPKDSKPQHFAKEVVTVLERFERDGRTGYRIAWKTLGMPWSMLHGERVQEFIEAETPDENGKVRTEYRCWETFGGVVAFGMKYFIGQRMVSGFGNWMNGLKDALEKDVLKDAAEG